MEHSPNVLMHASQQDALMQLMLKEVEAARLLQLAIFPRKLARLLRFSREAIQIYAPNK